MNIMIINGPSLSRLGTREPEIYGNLSYQDLVEQIKNYAAEIGINVEIYQTNHEGEIIDLLFKANDYAYDGIVLNAGAYTHYSYAIFDAIKAIHTPTIEVHLSDLNKREPFRLVSVIRPACKATFMGKGLTSYLEALDYLKQGE